MGIPPTTSKKFISACKKIGLEVAEGGKGSHTKIINPITGHSTTVPKGDLSFVRNKLIKWIENEKYSKKEFLKYL